MTEKGEKPIGLRPFKRVGCTVCYNPATTFGSKLLVLEHTGCNVRYNALIKLLEHTLNSSESVSITWWYSQLMGALTSRQNPMGALTPRPCPRRLRAHRPGSHSRV